ncbi:hypothetical protein [Rhizobium leguminosarum]
MGWKEESVKWPLGKPGGILLTMLLLPGVLAIFVQIPGCNFLPSNEWISKAALPTLAVSVVSAALSFWLILKSSREIVGVRKGFGLIIAPIVISSESISSSSQCRCYSPLSLAIGWSFLSPSSTRMNGVAKNAGHRFRSKGFRCYSTKFAVSLRTSGENLDRDSGSPFRAEAPVGVSLWKVCAG